MHHSAVTALPSSFVTEQPQGASTLAVAGTRDREPPPRLARPVHDDRLVVRLIEDDARDHRAECLVTR